MIGLELTRTGVREVTRAFPPEPLDSHAVQYRQLKVRGIGLEVVSHLVLGRIVIPRPWERHAVQAVEAVWREQPERVPPPPPRIADTRVRVQDDAVHAEFPEVVADRQAGLTSADHEYADALSTGVFAKRVEGFAFFDQALDP